MNKNQRALLDFLTDLPLFPDEQDLTDTWTAPATPDQVYKWQWYLERGVLDLNNKAVWKVINTPIRRVWQYSPLIHRMHLRYRREGLEKYFLLLAARQKAEILFRAGLIAGILIP